MYPGQFYPQDQYSAANVAAQVMAAARLQSHYAAPYAVGIPSHDVSQPMGSSVSAMSSSTGVAVDPSGNGPSANNRKLGLYKTELCRSWEEKGTCRYGPKCQFAHGEDEIRKVSRHPKVGVCSFCLVCNITDNHAWCSTRPKYAGYAPFFIVLFHSF